MKPKDISYITELDELYAKELKAIKNTDEFKTFLEKWEYWLDESTKKLKDWELIKPLIADCRKNVSLRKKHEPIVFLLMPERIFTVSIVANRFLAPWGCAYIRMQQEGQIDY